MPKKIINYQNTIIYKLVCNDLNITDIYVGHTTNFIKRKQCHKHLCYNPNDNRYNLKVYQMIRENDGWDNWSMIEIEKYPCNDNNEACARERYYYELLNAELNTRCPTINKEKIKAHKSKVCVCNICDSKYTHNNKSRHEKSKFHLNELAKNVVNI